MKTTPERAATLLQRSKKEYFRLLIDLDSGRATCVPDVSPFERNSLGSYVPNIRGSKKKIEGIVKRLHKRPSAVEKYIKILT